MGNAPGFLKFGFFTCCLAFSLKAGAIEILKDPFNTQKNLPQKQTGNCDNPETITNINLVQAIDVALCRNPDTKIAWANAKVASANLGQSESLYLPTVTLDGIVEKNY